MITDTEWSRAEADLALSGTALPLYHRLAWAECCGWNQFRLVTISDASGTVSGAVAVQSQPSRVLPLHKFLRVHRFAHGLKLDAIDALAGKLAALASADWRVLRLNINVFSRDRRGEIGAILTEHGFERVPQARSYRHTLTLDLHRSVEEILSGPEHYNLRRELSRNQRLKAVVVPLTDAAFAPVLAQMDEEAKARTGGSGDSLNAERILRLSGDNPGLSRVVGLFANGAQTGPADLLGFAWGCMHGDHGEYRAAGIRRVPKPQLAVSYPLMWDLIVWAKGGGATWFDLGGITQGDSENDPLHGISSFKRRFSRKVEEVGEEWTLVTSPVKLRLAVQMTGVLDRVRKV